MKICITLDDVLRAKTKQLGKIYKKYVKDIDLDKLEITSNSVEDILGLTKKEANKFLYDDYPFEIFGEAEVCEKMLDKKLNLWHLNMHEEYDGEYELCIANPYEFNTSIGNTCFFLAKAATRVREFHFPANSSDIWNVCDVLITADPSLLENKPEGKVSVKIVAPYNSEAESDLTYDTLSALLDDKEFFNKIKGEKE